MDDEGVFNTWIDGDFESFVESESLDEVWHGIDSKGDHSLLRGVGISFHRHFWTADFTSDIFIAVVFASAAFAYGFFLEGGGQDLGWIMEFEAVRTGFQILNGEIFEIDSGADGSRGGERVISAEFEESHLHGIGGIFVGSDGVSGNTEAPVNVLHWFRNV